MREVLVSGYRYKAMVDDEDYDRIAELGRWKLVKQNGRQLIRRIDYTRQRYKEGYVITLHRFVLGLAGEKRPQVYFKDGNIFNCQKDNLEVETIGPLAGEETYTCRICKRILPPSYFYKRKESNRYRSDCKDCFNKERRSQATPESDRRKFLWQKYKLTPEQWDQRLKAQDSRCAICKRKEPTKKGWQMDHDHRCCPKSRTCGKCLRGILCSPCNTLIGQARESKTTLMNAIDYLDHFATPPFEVFNDV